MSTPRGAPPIAGDGPRDPCPTPGGPAGARSHRPGEDYVGGEGHVFGPIADSGTRRLPSDAAVRLDRAQGV
jgi:hypothetical protein